MTTGYHSFFGYLGFILSYVYPIREGWIVLYNCQAYTPCLIAFNKEYSMIVTVITSASFLLFLSATHRIIDKKSYCFSLWIRFEYTISIFT